MFFRPGKKKELTLEQQILRELFNNGPMDGAQIAAKLLELDEIKLRSALSSLIESGLIEFREEQSDTEDFFCLVWGKATSFRKKTREQRKLQARRVLNTTQA